MTNNTLTQDRVALKRVNVYMPVALHRFAKSEAAKRDTSLSQLTSDALIDHIGPPPAEAPKPKMRH